jgi:hypothetical protein
MNGERMSAEWETKFRNWSAAPGTTEQARQENAERMVREAIRDHKNFANHDVRTILQGSYRNSTNVKRESDVDICVCCMDTFFYDLSQANYDFTDAQISPSPYLLTDFKAEVEAALVAKFERKGVKAGNKAFELRENSYRVDADVVAAFAYRSYRRSHNGLVYPGSPKPFIQPEGTRFFTSKFEEIINWPEQHYSNGLAKDIRTRGRYKAIVRSLKSLKFNMEENGDDQASKVPSYLVECLVYNVPDDSLRGESFYQNVRDCLGYAYEAATDTKLSQWQEVNGLKPLFDSQQRWDKNLVSTFAQRAWTYVDTNESHQQTNQRHGAGSACRVRHCRHVARSAVGRGDI